MRYAKLSELERPNPDTDSKSLLDLMTQGQPFSFLPFIHHALLVFSKDVSTFV